MKFCPQCGTTFEPEARFCLECGFDRSSVEPEAPEVKPAPGITVSEAEINSDSSADIPDLQTELRPVCPQCATAIDADDRFCPDCGFDTLIKENIQPEAPREIPQPAIEEIITPANQVENTVTSAVSKQFCPQCGSGFDMGERFCSECGFDTSSEKTALNIKPQPVVSPPVVEPPPVPKPVSRPQTPEPIHTAAPVYNQPARKAEPSAQQKGKSKLLWIVLVVLGVGVLGVAGWFGYSKYFNSPKEVVSDTLTNMDIPESTLVEAEEVAAEPAEQVETAAPEQPKGNSKPLSRMDQELARQKAIKQNKPQQPANTGTPKSDPGLTVKIASQNSVNTQPATVIMEVGRKEEPKSKNPKNATKLSINKPTMIVRITTDHYNDGMGTPRGGIITIKDKQGNTIGSYKALGKTGKSGAPSAKWVAEPNIVLDKGTYYIWDSDMATWSKNLMGNGFVVVEGYEIE